MYRDHLLLAIVSLFLCVTVVARDDLRSKATPSWHPHRANHQQDLQDEGLDEVESAFMEAVKAKAIDNTIVLAFTNWGDCQTLMPDNFAQSMLALNITNYLLVATDQKAKTYLDCRGFNTYYDERLLKSKEERMGFNQDLSSGYHLIALKRFNVLSIVIKEGMDALFSDTDVAILQNPFPKLRRANLDLQFLWDGKGPIQPKGMRGEGGGELQSNAGFFFARNSPAVKAFFAEVDKEMDFEAKLRMNKRGKFNDQEILSHSLEPAFLKRRRVTGLKWKLLPRDEYVNGWLVKNMFKGGECASPKNKRKFTAVHMNYNKGAKRKITHFTRCRWWNCEYCNKPSSEQACIISTKDS